MSAPTVEAKRPPSGGVLVAIAFGLMALAAIAAFLLLGTGGPIDGHARMQAVFGADALPFGLQIASATGMSSGGSLVVYEVPGSVPDVAPEPPKPAEPGTEMRPPDWTQVAIPAASGPPRQASFLFVPGDRGRKVLEEMIREVRGGDRAMFGPEGGTVLVERGRLDFRGWDSEWIHLRTYEPGNTFRDAMRISLSTPDDPCVMTATWPRGVPGSKAVLEELVAPIVAKR